ncbi:MAG TPA: hypothetical protein VHT91_18820 [Kofleriaceae bacterium]|jgi:hypothetical protein|nr:hypothetical protein [Kofleriaceae bacterium]
MTNSRSIASTSKLLAVAVAVAAVLGGARIAEAGRKRVVVLDFEGPRNEKFHDDLVRLIKKTHTVVPAEKWNGTAEQLGAGTRSDRDVKKVARKLKVDAIVEGKIEKRRDEFIIRLRLRAGKSGELVGDSIDTKAEGPRIDGRAQKDLKDELVGKIDDLESNHDGAGGDDADDDPPARRASRTARTDDDDDRPARKPARAEKDDDDDRPAARKTARKPAKKDDDDADDDRPARRSKFAGRSDDERGSDRVGKGKKPEADADDEPAPKKTAKPPAKPDKPDRSDDDDDKLPPKKPAGKPAVDDARPTAKDPPNKPATRPSDDDDDDKLPPKKPAGKPAGDDARVAAKDPANKPAARPSGDDDDDKLPPRKPAGKSAGNDARRGKAKQVATRDDDEAAQAEARLEPLDAATALSPGERFLDAALGMSVTMRRLTFAYSPELRARPNGYSGVPAPGALLDVTAYPLALGHTRRDVVKDIGLELLYDRVLKLSSKASVNQGGTVVTSSYSTLESRFALTAVFRHALGSSPAAPVVLGSLGYHRQQFNILGKVDLPDVKYSMFAPGVGLRFPVFSKLILGADAKLLLPTSTGMIQDPDQYGQAKVYGFDLSAAADYLIKPNIFARAAARFETINFAFAGKGSQSNARDNDPMTQDVTGAHDSYIGGFLTIGYLY